MSLRSKLYAFFAAQTGRPVIFVNQNGPRPGSPFVTLLPGAYVRLGEDWQSEPDDQGQARVVGHRELTVSVQFFGGAAFEDAMALQEAFQLDSVREGLAAQGLVYVDAGAVTDLTGLLDSRWERRAGLDLRLRLASEQTTDVGLIETVAGEGTVEGSAGGEITREYEIGA